jgi:cytochrome b subunit of formate dehydrogenase
MYLVISFGLKGVFSSIGLEIIADVHTAAAIAVLVFVILHVYLLTTGHSFVAHVRPMVTGYDDVDLSEEEYAFLKSHESGQVKD